MMQREKFGPLVVLALLAVFLLALGLFGPQVTQVSAQVKGEVCNNGYDDDGDKLVDCEDPDCAGDPYCKSQEICDNGIDDDGDKLVDCEDPDCVCEPEGKPCSPGYWKNHLDDFNAVCGQVSGWTCDELYTAITCRGSNASCRRSEAAEALNAVSGCTE